MDSPLKHIADLLILSEIDAKKYIYMHASDYYMWESVLNESLQLC